MAVIDAIILAILAWLPLAILLAVTVPLWIHLGLFIKCRFGSGFGHITDWRWFAGMALFLSALSIGVALLAPQSIVDHVQAGEYESLWSFWALSYPLVCSIAALSVAGFHIYLCTIFGRCLFISGSEGTIRYYPLWRPWPKKPATHVDLVQPLQWNRHMVDIWELGRLSKRDSAKKLVGGVNYFLEQHRNVSVHSAK